jgi:hypothetical protein
MNSSLKIEYRHLSRSIHESYCRWRRGHVGQRDRVRQSQSHCPNQGGRLPRRPLSIAHVSKCRPHPTANRPSLLPLSSLMFRRSPNLLHSMSAVAIASSASIEFRVAQPHLRMGRWMACKAFRVRRQRAPLRPLTQQWPCGSVRNKPALGPYRFPFTDGF